MIAIAVAIAAGTSSCNALLGIEERPLRLGSDEGGSPDAGEADGASSSGAPDGTTIADGGSVCSAPHLFCDDFGGGDDDPATRWDDLVLGAGPIDFDTSEFESAPRSLRVRLTAGSGTRTTWIEKRIAVTATAVTVAFDVRIDTPTSTDFGAIEYASVTLLPAGSDTVHTVALFQYGTGEPTIGYYLSPPAGDTEQAALEPPLGHDAWHRIAFRIRLDASPKVSVSVDQKAAAVLPLASFPLREIRIGLGFGTAEANTTTTARYDDVTVDLE